MKRVIGMGLVVVMSMASTAIGENVLPGSISLDFEVVTTRADVGGFFTPIHMDQPGNGSLYFADNLGQVISHTGGSDTVFLDLTSHADVPFTTIRGGGLFGIAFHPDYASVGAPGYRKFYTYSTDFKTTNQTSANDGNNNLTPGNQLTGLPDFWHDEMYAPAVVGNPLTNWTNPDGGANFDHFNVLREWTATADGTSIDTGVTPRVLIRMAHGYGGRGSHNGGGLAFGPDGYLYLSTGDGGGNSGQDHQGGIDSNDDGHTNGTGNGQDRTVIYGKVLRLDPTAAVKNSVNGQYGIPADNPYVVDNSNPDFIDELYAYGFRNPWKLSFDSRPDGNGALYLSDVGQHHREEIDLIENGGNYGWGYLEGRVRLVAEDSATGEPDPGDLVDGTNGTPIRVPAGGFDAFEQTVQPPLLDYLTRRQTVGGQLVGEGTAVTGGFVYRGTAIPELYGMYVFGDFSIAGSPPPGLPASVGRLFYYDPILAGDYNDDGSLNAADYTVWRDHLGSTTSLPNDRTAGSVTMDDYVVWKNGLGGVHDDTIYEFDFDYTASEWDQLLSFGQDADGELYALLTNGNVLKLTAAAALAQSAVPEPATATLLLSYLITSWIAGRRAYGWRPAKSPNDL